MSLFVCQNCETVENTASCLFWVRETRADQRALCSSCDPKIGKWHGLFPRETYDRRKHKVHWLNGQWLDEPVRSASAGG